jgi:cation-transporting ATPase I
MRLTGLLGVALALPGRVLEVLETDRVGGRRASLRHGRATIEVRCAQRPNGSRYSEILVRDLQQLPGVRWACVNAPLSRVIVALDTTPPTPTLPDLVAVVDRVDVGIQRAARGYRGASHPAEPARCDGLAGGVERAMVTLGVNVAGMVLAGVGAVSRFTPLPAEVAALVTAVEAQPRVRELLEAVLGRPATDVGLALLNAAGQSVSGGWLGLSVDAAQRTSALGATRAAGQAWQARESELLADPQRAAAEPIVVERPRPLPLGPVESYAERAALLGLGAAGVALPVTGKPRRAAALALAATPKAARGAREAFAAGLVRLLVKRGAVVLDAVSLRLLDRVDTIVLDAEAVGAALEGLVAAARRSGTVLHVAGLHVAGLRVAGSCTAVDAPPGGTRLLGTVRSLQSTGAVVLLVSRHAGALGSADVGIGVDDTDGRPPWGAHVLVGDDLELAAMLIEACAAARQVSRRGVILSQAGSAVGAVGALSGSGWSSRPTRAAMMGVNCAAAAAFVQGSWSAAELGHQPPLILPVCETPWHAMPVEKVLDQLNATSAGLSEDDAARRRDQLWRPQLVRTSLARAVMEELDNPLTPILAAGAVLSASLGSVVDAGLIAGVSALSALIGGRSGYIPTGRWPNCWLVPRSPPGYCATGDRSADRPSSWSPVTSSSYTPGTWCPLIAGCCRRSACRWTSPR